MKKAIADKIIKHSQKEIKKLAKDETIGYGNTFKAKHDMTVATLPVGYFEGVDRRLSNIGGVDVTINFGDRLERIACPIIGRVSMNISSIDVTNATNAVVGTEVVVISNDSSKLNSIRGMAKLCGTIEYETAVYIPEHLKRVITP